MIDPDKLEAMAQVIYDRENQFNTYTLEKIAKRVKATGELSAYDQESLKNIADITGDMDAITKELARITKLNIADVEKIYAKTINDGINSYEPLYNFKNIEFKSYKDNEYALKLVRHWAEITAEKMINLSNAKIIGFTDSEGNFTTIAGTYQQVIDDAIVAVSNGTVDFNSAMAETIKQLGGSGVVTNYGNKITRPIESAIRSNILYGAKKAAESYDNYVSDKLGLDGFEVDAHSGCRPSHVFMQGKMYSYKGDKVIKGVKYEDGTDALAALEDYGCLHFKTGVLLGVSEPRYSPEELEQIYKETTELIEYNGKKKTLYEWKQTQRRLEREYRKTKTQSDTFKAAGNNAKAREYKEAAKAIKDNYDTMTKTIPGLYKHHERMRTYFNSTASVKGATQTPKKVIETLSKEEKLKKDWENISAIQDRTERIRKTNDLIGQELGIQSLFSGVVKYDDTIKFNGTANYDGSITLRTKASQKTEIHELLHHHSKGGDNKISVYLYKNIEEASVELLAQEICKSKRIKIADFDYSYSSYVDALKTINSVSGRYASDYDFAKALFGVSLDERKDFLKSLSDGVSKENMRFFRNALKTLGVK